MLYMIRKYTNERKLARLPRAVMAVDKSKKEIILRNKNFIKVHDFFILSYPRSGNTWLRLMMCDVFTQKMGIDTDFGVPFDLFSPTIEKHLLEEQPDRVLGFYLFKTHNANLLGEQKFIYVYRDPVDSIVSYYRFLKKRAITALEPELLEFCRREIANWNASIEFAYNNLDRCLPVKFENLLSDTAVELKRSLEFVGIDYSQCQIDQAVANNSMQKQKARKIQENQGKNISYLLATGTAKGNYSYLDVETIQYIKDNAKNRF